MKEKPIFICKVCGTHNDITESHCKKCGKDLNLFADVILQAEEEFCESAATADAEVFIPKIIADDLDNGEKTESKEEAVELDSIKHSDRFKPAGNLIGDLPKKADDTPLKETVSSPVREEKTELKVVADKKPEKKTKPSEKEKPAKKAEAKKKGTKKGLIIGLVCVIVLAITAGVIWYICTENGVFEDFEFSGGKKYDEADAEEAAMEVVERYFDALQDYDQERAMECFLDENDCPYFYVDVDEVYGDYYYVPRMGTQEAYVQELTDEFLKAYHDYYLIMDIQADNIDENTVIVTVKYECMDPEYYKWLYEQEIYYEDLYVQALEDAGLGKYEWVDEEDDLYYDIYDIFLEYYQGEDTAKLEAAGLFFESMFEMRKDVLSYSSLMDRECEIEVVYEDGEWLIEDIDG